MKRTLLNGFLLSFLLIVLTFTSNSLYAQTTISTQVGSTGYTGANGLSGACGITFVIENTSGNPMNLTEVATYLQVGTNGASMSLWYSSTSLSGATPGVTTTDWTKIATTPSVSVPVEAVTTVFTGMSFLIPNGSTYRFCIESSSAIRYSGSGAGSCTPSVFTSGGVSLRVGESTIGGSNIGYSVTFPAGTLGNNPRWFTGTVTLQPALPCVAPPTAGTAITSAALVCPSTNFDLNLAGSSIGTGMSYQWQQSSDSLNWTNITLGTTQKFTTSLTATTYYRCEVTCSAVSAISSVVKVGPRPLLAAGTYTINANLPSSATNFIDFASVIQAISCGVAGDVIFNVDSNTYVGKLEFSNIPNTGPTKTITFNGNKSKITHTSGASDPTNYVILIKDANYITFNNFVIELNSASTKGAVVSFWNANYNTIKNCKIIGDMSGTGSTYAGIVFSGSATSPTTATNAKYNIIEDNEIYGGYYGITLVGTTATTNVNGNTIRRNTIRDFYLYGIYNAAADSTQIISNNIHRLNRLTVSTGYGVYLATNSQYLTISKNKIHDFFPNTPTSTSTSVGIYFTSTDALVGKEALVSSNLIYNTGNNGTNYGIQNTGSNGTFIYHNTIVLDHPNSTAGVGYGIYQTTAASNINIRNNIISITKGGSGVKNALYFATTTSTIICNYNNLYVNTSVSGTGAKNIGNWGTTGYGTLLLWQGANASAFDQNSLSEVANFNANYVPNNTTLDNSGVFISTVTDDINGAIRNVTTPDIGAYEFSPILNDASVTLITNPGASLCPGLTTIGVKVKNFGLNTMTSVMVNWSINNIAQPVYSSGVLNLPIGTDTTLEIGTYNFISGVNYDITIWSSSPSGGADNVPANDTIRKLNLKTGFAGVVTVGGVGANYPTITAAVHDLQTLGICGPITINVNPNAGPYLEQVSINPIPGTSSVNRVTFKGNNAEIRYETNNTNLRSVVSLNGADYITIDSFIINGYRGALTTNYAWGVSMSAGSHFNKIINNIISVSDSTSSSNYAGIVLSGSTTSSTTAGEFKYDTIENNIVSGGYYGITLCGTSGSSALSRGNVIKGNRVRNAYYYTMYLSYQDSLMVKNNDLSMQTRTVTSVTHYVLDMIGIGAKAEIAGNKIHDYFIATPTITGTCYIVYNGTVDNIIGSETMVYNNNIYNMGGNVSYYGLYNTGCDGFGYYHNTVVLDHPAATTAFSYAVYQTTLASNITYKNNNIFVNRGGVGSDVGMYFATNTSLITSDYNDIYVPNGNVGYWNALVPTLAAWKSANSTSPYDLNSISADPLLNSSKINIPQAGSPIINAGTQISSIQFDLLGNPRSGTSPYLGSYELNGDYSGPVLTFVPILNSANTTGNTLTGFLTATDIAGIDTTLANRPRVYYKKATDKNEFNNNTSATDGWKYAVATNNTSPFNFQLDYSNLFGGTASVGTKIEYFVVAKDILGNLNVEGASLLADPTNINLTNKQFPATSPAFYKIGVGVNGTMLVGTNETYKSLTGAGGVFEYINNNLLGGNVEVIIKTNITESGLNALNAFAETGGSNYKINIRSIDDTLKTITGAYVGGLIRINGADRVTIDGRFNGAGKFLKVENTTATSGSAGIQIISLGNNAGSENITIRNTIVLSGTAGNSIPIHIGGPALPYSPGASNNKIKILDNTILRGSVGIYSGSVANFESDSLVVDGNTIGGDITSENIRLYGLALEVQKNPIINNNTIKNIINISAQQAWGIATYDGFKNGKITNNKIEKVSSGSGAFGGRGIEIVSGKSSENILIANNFVGEITGPGSKLLSSSATIGIGIINTGGVSIYNNSINLAGNISASTTLPDTSAGIYIGAGSGFLNIRNNSIVNSLFNAADTSVAYALYSSVSDTAFININNNNYFTGSGNIQGKLGRVNGNDLVTLAQVQVATTKDLNSISGNPNYINSVDLHAQGATLYQKGVSISSITTDIDGNTRNPIPCIGADEFVPPANDVEVVGIIYPKALSCGKPIDSVGVVLKNLGTSSQTNFNIKVEISGVVSATLNKVFTKVLSVNARDTIYLGTYNSNVQGIANFKVYSELSNDAIRLNDTIVALREFATTPAMPTASNATICKGTAATLVASNGSLSYSWYDAPVGGNMVSGDDTLITPALTSNTKYWVETAAGTTTGSIKITEIDIGGTDMIEIQNLSPTPVNTAGWKVIVSDSYTVINAVNTIAWQLPAQMTGGQVLYKTDGTTDNYWGNNLFWNPGAFPTYSGWAIILDNNDAVVDAVFMNWPATNIAGAAIVYNSKSINIADEWSGNAVNITTVAATNSVSRAGNKDNNDNTDFQIVTTSKGVVNPVIILPFISNGCPSDRREVLVSMLPKPIGSTVAQSTPFQGVFNAGTSIQPDAACVNDTLTYDLTPPTGFTVGGLGTTWNVLNPTIKTNHGAAVTGSVLMTGLSLRYIASAGDKDSTLVFTATIQDLGSGCDSLIERYLNVSGTPEVNLGPDQTICDGTPLVLTADSSTSYLWSTGATTRAITVSTGGTYSVTVTNAAGCDATDAIVINVNPKPVVDLGPNISTCVGTPVLLDAGNPGATYSWSTGATTQTLNVTTNGAYIVTVTGTNGCITKDTITVNFKLAPVVNLGSDLTICTSDTITLDAGNPSSTYLWSTGATTRTIKVSLAGTYSVEVTNADGCKKTDEVVITNKPIPNANYTAQGVNTLNVQFTGTEQPGSTYAWNFGDPTSSANTSALYNPIHEFTAAGTYFVRFTVTNVATGCVSVNVDTIVVTFIGVNSTVRNTQHLVAIPNPFVGSTKVEYVLAENANNVSIEVYDVVGRKIATLLNGEAQLAGKHSINYVNEDRETGSGVYIVQLTVDGKTSIIRMVDIANK